MNTRKVGILGIITVLLVASAAVHAASLRDVVTDSIGSSPDVLIAGSERDTAEQQMEQARSGFFPQTDITVGSGWESSDNPTTRNAGFGSRGLNRDEAEIRVRQLLYDGEATYSDFERNRARVNSHAYDTFSTAETVALKAVEAYLNVVKEQKLVKLASDNLANHQSVYDRIVKRGESGVGNRADVQQALGRLALARSNLLAEQNRLQDASAAFNSTVGHAPDSLEEAPSYRHLLPDRLQEAVSIALDNHPRLKSANADIDAAVQQHEAARALFAPRVHLEIKGSDNANLDGISGSNNDAEIMLRGRYSFTGGKDMARRKETAIQLDQARQIRDRTYRQVVESMQLSWNAWQTATSQLEFFRTHVDASKDALDAYRKQFNIGQRTLLDLLDQENEVFQASINQINGQTSALYAEYRILAGMGKLLWALGVDLPEQANTIQ